jgi:hypothetical protein
MPQAQGFEKGRISRGTKPARTKQGGGREGRNRNAEKNQFKPCTTIRDDSSSILPSTSERR